MPVTKILIDNRGEIALRILKTAQRLGIGAVVGYSASDAETPAVRYARGLADDRYGAVLLGGFTAADSYEDVAGVIAAAKSTGCDAVHPGYGFLSEQADAAEAINVAGLTFIGPAPDVIRAVGNKAAARDLAQSCGVPLMPASRLLHRYQSALDAAAMIGFPLVLKADIGGGGMNNLFVDEADDLRETFETFSLRNPGGFYVEKKLERARHIEVQVAADAHGHSIVLGERDCTAQRKAQKVIEEAPVTVVPEPVLARMRADALTMAKSAGYTSVGTWEFLYDSAAEQYYFMEINPRIQVEHTVTEQTYDGLDIVQWQVMIANGQSLPELPPRIEGHVVQLRVYAEDPRAGFMAAPGTLALLRLPVETADVRVDRGYDEGDTLAPGFDTTIAKLIVRGSTREAARHAALDALDATLVSGVASNLDFLRWLLRTPEFIDDAHWTTYVEPAWANEQAARFRDISRFFKGGSFEEFAKPADFDAANYLHDIAYERRGVKRRYSTDLAKVHEQRPDRCSFRYGIFMDAHGRKLAVGYWDFAIMGGTLGSEEGAAVVDLFKRAQAEGLPVVTITSSSGARQQEGAKALEMMDVIVAARWRYRPSAYVNVYCGLNFGGVTVSLAESADVSLALTGSQVGFAGPDLVARMMGKAGGAELGEGAHSAEDASANRAVDVLVDGLDEARERIFELCSILDGAVAERSPLAPYQTAVDMTRHDRPSSERFVTLVGELDRRMLMATSGDVPAQPETVSQRRQVINDPGRPTAADWLAPARGVFAAGAMLSNRFISGASEQYAPIVGAVALLDRRPVLVLGQQTGRYRTERGIEKTYVAPRARDFRWALRKAEWAQRLGLPVILLCDTTGGDASLAEEADGVSRAIADFLGLFYRPDGVSTPAISIVIGENGSGGGLTFGRPLDASADLANALTFVATPEAQVKILTGHWPSEDRPAAPIIDQLRDADAAGRLALGQIDEIIPETAQAIHHFLSRQLEQLSALEPDERLTRRFERVERAGRYGLIPSKIRPSND